MKKNNKMILILTLFIVIVLSVGYSSYSTNLLFDNLTAFIRINKDIRITGVTVESSNSGGVSNYEEYNVSSISSNLHLPNSDSSVTYKVTITNIEGPEMGVYAITGLPENLDYSISNYILKDKICDINNNCSLGISKEIYITIKYKNYDSNNKTFNLTLNFDFREVQSITYENIDGSLYQSEVLNGDKLELDFGENIVYCTIKDSNGNEIADDGTYYEFSSGKLTIYSVTDNLTISVSETAPAPTLLSTIRDLYLNADKTVVTEGDASYYYAESVLLMNDGLDTEGNITNNETKGNIRYYGDSYSSIPNNYIYFNCDDYSDISTCETWRIIGVIDGKVKIMNEDALGSFSWDYNYNDNQILGSGYETDWNTSSLKELLNGAYYNNFDTEYYNYSDSSNDSGGGSIGFPEDDDLDGGDIDSSEDTTGEYPEEISYETWFNYRGTGITEATRTNNLISDTLWNINKVSYTEYSSAAFTTYQQEQQGSCTWFGKIALVDLSDVIFSSFGRDYYGWLGYRLEGGWTLSIQDDSNIYYISERGITTVEPIFYNSYWGVPTVYSTLYLSPELVVDQETDGSSSNPYKLIIE